jgi:hypothetical protein
MKIAINNARLAFPVLFKAEQFNGIGEPAYSCSLLLPPGHPAIKAIEDGIEAVGSEKWGKGWPAVKKTAEKKDLNCLHDGDLKSKYAGFEGNMYVSTRASEDKRPTVVDRNRTPLTAADGKIYGGCYVNAIVVLWAQDNQFGQRVNAQITGVQFFADGDSFGGGAMAASADDFADVTDGADADDLS